MATQAEEHITITEVTVKDIVEVGEEKSTVFGNSVPDDDVSTFPFSGTSDDYMNPAKFVRNLYEGKRPWISYTPGRLATDFPWMVMRMGHAQLKPELPKEPVADAKNPNWRWAECWRALNTYKALLKKAESKKTKYPVKDWLDSFPGNDKLLSAMFPPDVKRLLIDNEKNIVAKGFEWVGSPTYTPPGTIYPYSGVLVTNGSPKDDFKFHQTGGMGQMCIEASFILATQLAGINWKTLQSKIASVGEAAEVYWISGILPDDKGDRKIEERRKGLPERKDFGYLSRPSLLLDGSPDAGCSLALDIDPDYTGRHKNVFLFACHFIDPHARVYVKNPAKTLHDMHYVTPYRLNDFTPSQMPDKQKDGVRFYGHGHACVMTSEAWLRWVEQKINAGQHGEKMPDYKQIGEGHLYFLTEDEDAVWPRRAWINANPA